MRRTMFRLAITTAAAFLIFSGFLSPASGCIPPAPFIIEMMLKQLNLPKQMQVTQELRVYLESEQEPENLEQKVRYRMPGAVRSEIETGRLQRIHLSNQGSTVTIVDGELVEGRKPWYECYNDLFVFYSRKSMVKHLSGIGIDANVSSLGRIDRELVYVIGSRYPNERRPQIWIGKNSFLPMRWIVTPARESGEPPVQEIRYLRWQKVEKAWYPFKTEFYENGEKVQTMEVKSIETNPSFPRDLFNPETLRASASRFREERTDEGRPGGEIRQQLQEFKNIYESGSQ